MLSLHEIVHFYHTIIENSLSIGFLLNQKVFKKYSKKKFLVLSQRYER